MADPAPAPAPAPDPDYHVLELDGAVVVQLRRTPIELPPEPAP